MDIQIPLTIKIMQDKQSKSAPWVAYTPELDVASCGETRERAKKNLLEAIQIVLRGAAEDGNLQTSENLYDGGLYSSWSNG